MPFLGLLVWCSGLNTRSDNDYTINDRSPTGTLKIPQEISVIIRAKHSMLPHYETALRQVDFYAAS